MFENNIKDIIDAQNGNQQMMEKLVNENTGLIWSIVKRFKDRGYEIEDLYQIGSIGFIKSIKRFDLSYDVKLSTYAVPYIIGEIKRFIRDDGSIKISRNIKETATKIREVQSKYIKEFGKDITINEISKELKISKEDITVALDSLNPIISIYEETYSSDEKSLSIIDKLSSNIDEEEQITNKISVQKLIENLDDREKKIILLRYYKNMTQSEVSSILGISQVQVSRIEKKVLNSMKMKLVV